MNADTLRRLVYRTPFRPLVLTLDDGTKVRVEHPEVMMLSDVLCGVARDPQFPLLFEPEKVLSVEYVRKNGNARRRSS